MVKFYIQMILSHLHGEVLHTNEYKQRKVLHIREKFYIISIQMEVLHTLSNVKFYIQMRYKYEIQTTLSQLHGEVAILEPTPLFPREKGLASYMYPEEGLNLNIKVLIQALITGILEHAHSRDQSYKDCHMSGRVQHTESRVNCVLPPLTCTATCTVYSVEICPMQGHA